MTDKTKMLEKLLQRWEKQPDVMLPCAGSHTCGEVAGWIRALRAAAASPIADLVAAAGEYRPSSAEEIAAAEEAFRVAAASAEPVAWRYQSKEGWEGIWRVTNVDPTSPGFFETPSDWNVEPLYTHPAPDAEIVAALETVTVFIVEEDEDQVCVSVCGVKLAPVPKVRPSGRALLKFDAMQRAALAKAKGGSRS